MQNFMRDAIQIESRELIVQINNYHETFSENDIRSSYLDGYFQILRTFYCSFYHLDSDDIMTKYNEIYNRDNFERKDIDIHIQGHKNLLNSFLIINCWSNFELFCTVFCNAILPEGQIKNLLELDYQRLNKILKDIEIGEDVDNKLKKLIKNHISHSPIINKYGKLLKMITNYPDNRDKKADREFLEFFGTLRNCMHSNYIYYGATDKSYTFNGETYTFTNGQLLSHNPSTERSIYDLTKNLKDIFMVIAENILFEDEIYDPSVELIS
ncbi:hypothetical protein ES705_35202 [subsurface metagenome]